MSDHKDRTKELALRAKDKAAEVLILREVEGRNDPVTAHLIQCRRSLVQAPSVRALRSLNDELA